MNEATIWKFFRGKGLNGYGVAGLMGNLYAESALNPQNLQQTYEKKLGFTDASYTAAVDNGSYTNFVRDSAGYGLAQWTYWSRKEALLNFVKARGTSVGDLNTQLDFLWKELGQYGLVDSLKHAQSVLEASNLILLNFERPASMNEPSTQRKRAEYGQRYYDEFAAEEAATTAGQEGVSSMKYTEKNKPLVCMMTNSTCYKGTRKTEVKGVLWHSTGANNPNLRRYVQPSNDDPN